MVARYKDKQLNRGERRRCFDALAALLDISVCLKWLGQFELAASIISWLRWAIELMKAKKGKGGIELAEHFEPLELKIHFRAAELILTPVDRWDFKNDAVGAGVDFERRCELAIKECDAGLSLVHETNTKPEQYFLNRSSFRIHRARALALRSNFVTAQQDMDRAMAGLDPRTATGRNSLAVRTLYLADALMAWSDYQLMSNCRSALPNPSDPQNLSPRGRFFVGFSIFIRATAPHLDTCARELLRRAMTPWVDFLPHDPVKACTHARQSLSFIRAVNPKIEESAALEAEAALMNAAAWKHAAAVEIDQEQLLRDLSDHLERSLAYWDAAALRSVDKSRWNWRRIGQQGLAIAQSTLDQAEGYLTDGRRDIRFWHLLHRLRAQACFEELLMLLTLGPDDQIAIKKIQVVEQVRQQEQMQEKEHMRKHARQRFHARFVDRARVGLRALAHAHDDLLDDADPRADALKRLRFQILLACAYNEWIQYSDWVERQGVSVECKRAPQDDEEFATRFWKRWSWLTRSVGHDTPLDLDTPRECKDYLKAILTSASADDLNYSLAARAFIERHIKIYYHPRPPVPDLSARSIGLSPRP